MSPTQFRILTIFASLAGLVGVVAQRNPSPGPQPVLPGEAAALAPTVVKPFLGVIVTKNPDKATAGLVLEKRIVDGPAAIAGLQVNDVLLRLDDQILLVEEQLGLLIRRHAVGDELTFTFLRPGHEEPQQAKVILAAAPSPNDRDHRPGLDPKSKAPPNPRITKRTVRLSDEKHAIAITTLEGQPFLTVIRLPSRNVEFQGAVTLDSMQSLSTDVQQKVQRVAKIENKKWVFALPPLRPPRQLPPNTAPSGPAPSYDFPIAPPLKQPEKEKR